MKPINHVLAAAASVDELSAGHFRDHDFTGCQFGDAELSRLTFEGCDFSGADFTGARLARTTFHHCKLVGAVLRRASMAAGTFRDCDLSDVDARDIDLSSVQVSRCTIDRAVFDRAQAPKSEWFESSLRGSSWCDANLTRAGVRACDLEHARLDRTNLTRATLARCALAQASFVGTWLRSTFVLSPTSTAVIGAPRDPWHVHGDGSEQLFAAWNRHRTAPGTIASPVSDELMQLEILDANPVVASRFAPETTVFHLAVPWFRLVSIVGVIADDPAPARLVFVAALADDRRLVLEQQPASLAIAAATEGLVLQSADAVEYARFAAYVVLGRVLSATATASNHAEGWTVAEPGCRMQVQPTGAVTFLHSELDTPDAASHQPATEPEQ